MRYLITTPIYYINDKPHIGHAYSTVAADILTRWLRLNGHEAFFLGGTDENSQKTVQAAEASGLELRAYTQAMADVWENTWRTLGLGIDYFIRTTAPEHVSGVRKFWEMVASGQIDGQDNIYRGIYTGLYCEGCETYLKESELVNGFCPYHNKPPLRLDEENYFFRLEAYRERLLELFDAHPSFVHPRSRYNEVRQYVDHHLEPLSISRATRDWGIPVPGDDAQVIYVWFDALLNYLTGSGYGWNEKRYDLWWGPETQIIHFVGKDITKFHCAIWPAMLIAGGFRVPSQVVANGFFTIDGVKISKSLGNAIDPVELAARFGFDTVRYFLFREIPFGEDGDFSFTRLEQRYKADLSNDLGNLLNRVLVMCEKYHHGQVPSAPLDNQSEIAHLTEGTWSKLSAAVEGYHFDVALESIWSLLALLNQTIDQEKPWELAKANQTTELARTVYTWLEALRHVAGMLAAFMPETANRMLAQLGFEERHSEDLSIESWKKWGGLQSGQAVARAELLFPALAD